MKKSSVWIISSIVTILISYLLFICFFKINNSDKIYLDALEKYNNSDFYPAKKLFKKVSIFSPLKPAAIYREAICANKIGNITEELKYYEYLRVLYPKSIVTPRAVYYEARLFLKKKKFHKALGLFKQIAKKYPDTKYALASNYYIAFIESEKLKHKSNNEREIITRLKKYLIDAPNGIYALNCLNLLSKYTLSDEENLIVGKTYLINKKYNEAEKYLSKVNLNLSWPYLVQVYYANKNYAKVKNFTRLGLSTPVDIITNSQIQDSYKAIDLYIKTFDNKNNAINSLLSIGNKNNSYDYIMYLNCNSSNGYSKNLCYSSIYQLYPRGNFAPEALANVFISMINSGEYKEAIKLGNLHLMNYKKSKSTPKVLYWMAFLSNQTKNFSDEKYYFSKLMKEYPDDYYTYLTFINTNNVKYLTQTYQITPKEIEFPYLDTKDKFLKSLFNVNDYGFINTFYEEDGFIKSWLLYKEGDYSTSARIARDTMDKLEEKPEKDDLRWRLVYPIHYYDIIEKYSTSATDKTLILSIIREESYFNHNAKSHVGAIGLMQLMPVTAKEISQKINVPFSNSDLLYEAGLNINLGIKYFAYISSLLSGSKQLGILAYNGGIGSVRNWQSDLNNDNFNYFIEMIPYQETQNYYKKVYRSYWNYLRIYDGLNF